MTKLFSLKIRYITMGFRFQLTLLIILVFGVFTHAVNGRTTYQAKIVKPDGQPLEAVNVNFKFSILDPGGSCILYAEAYSSVNMSGSGGLISFALGSGIKTYPTSSTTFLDVFSNQIASLSCDAGGPGTYSPVVTDNRKIVMQFNDGGGWQTLPAMSINAVPYAMYAGKANDTTTLNGKADSAFVENATLASLGCNSATHAIAFNGVSFSCLAVGSGASGAITTLSVNSPISSTGGSNPTLSIAQANSSTNGYLSSTDFNTFNSKQVATSSAIITTLGYTPADNAASGTYLLKSSNLSDLTNTATARTNLGLGTLALGNNIDLGSASATGTLAIARLPLFIGDATVAAASNTILLSNSGVTAGTYTKVTVDSKGRVTSSSVLISSDVTAALGYIPANSATTVSSQWVNSGTAISYSAGNVGIGTVDSRSPLHVNAATSGITGISARITDSNNSLGGSVLVGWTGAAIDSKYKGLVVDSNGFNFGKFTDAFDFTAQLTITSTNNVGIGTVTPTAKLHLPAGTSSTASLKLTSGTLLTSPQSGNIEYDGFNFYLTDSATNRKAIATGSSVGTIDNTSSINSSGNITMTPTGSVIVSSTTASVSSNTGALIVNGGLGVIGNIYSSGTILTSSNIEGSSITATSGILTNVIQGNTNLLLNPNTGNVGIGTSTPNSQLNIGGNITSSAWGSGITFKTNPATYSDTSSSGTVSTNYINFFGTPTLIATAATTYTNAATLVVNGAPVASTNVTNTYPHALLVNSGQSTFLGNTSIGTPLSFAKLTTSGFGGASSNEGIYQLGSAAAVGGATVYSGIKSSISQALTSGNQTGSITGFSAVPSANVGAGLTTSEVLGFYAVPSKNGATTGTLTNLVGFKSSPVNSSNGIVTNSRSIWITNPSNIGTGSITNTYGLYIDNITTGTNRWSIYSNGGDNYFAGNVAIGSSTAAAKVYIYEASPLAGSLRIEGSSLTHSAATDFYTANAHRGFVGWRSVSSTAPSVTGVYLWNRDNSNLILGTSDTEVVRITQTGNVGIGTTSPAATLDVNGRIKSTMARAQFSASTGLTTTSTAWVDTDVTLTVTTTGGPLLLMFNSQAITDTAAGIIAIRFVVDGNPVTAATYGNAMIQNPPGTTTYQQNISANWLATGLAAGSHTIKVQMRIAGASNGYLNEASEPSERTLVVIEQ